MKGVEGIEFVRKREREREKKTIRVGLHVYHIYDKLSNMLL